MTTLLDIGPGWDGWAAPMAKSGLRAYLAPGFSSARWKMEGPSKLGYACDEKGDRQRLDAALKVVDGAAKDPSGRLSGVLCPMQIDTCTEELLEEMRTAVTLARIASRDIHSVSTADIQHAAAVGGAKALGRDDIGVLAPGKRADLVIVDLKRLDMMPARDRCAR